MHFIRTSHSLTVECTGLTVSEVELCDQPKRGAISGGHIKAESTTEHVNSVRMPIIERGLRGGFVGPNSHLITYDLIIYRIKTSDAHCLAKLINRTRFPLA